MKRVVLFDLDGTLSDPYVGIASSIRYALVAMGKPVPGDRELRRWIGPPLLELFCEHLGSRAAAEEALSLYRERFSAKGLYENELYPGMEPVLRSLRALVDGMYVVTSKPGIYAEQIIRYFELEPHFDAVYGSELDGRRADKAELIEYVVKREALVPGRTVMIGDRSHDMRGAAKNGVRGIGVLWGFGSREELEAAGAAQICDAVDQLPHCIADD